MSIGSAGAKVTVRASAGTTLTWDVREKMCTILLCAHRAIEELKRRKLLVGGEQVAIVQSGRQPIWRSASTHNISVRKCPEDPDDSDD